MAPSIYENILILNASEPYPLPVITDLLASITGDYSSALSMTSIPVLWLYMIGNLITQYMCISSVFYLTSVFASLTVTLLMTLRKFFSLLISVFYFKNNFTQLHWLGASFVFLGTLIYADLLSLLDYKHEVSLNGTNGEQFTKSFRKAKVS